MNRFNNNELNTKQFVSYSANDLQSMDIKEPSFIVVGLITCGVSILAASPKAGKSWLCVDLCLAVSKGEPFLGFKTNMGDTLYFALEDTPARLQGRIDKVLAKKEAPSNFRVAFSAETLQNGFLKQLNQELTEYPNIKLVVIDTYQKVKGTDNRGASEYEIQYQTLGKLKEYADRKEIAIILVHHTRKNSKKGEDPFEKILGSNAIAGATDTMMVITKDKSSEINGTLHIVGRDIEQQELIMTFDKSSCRWINNGTFKQMLEKRKADNFIKNPIVETIVQLVLETGYWKGNIGEFKRHMAEITGTMPESNNRALSVVIRNLAEELEMRGKIEYISPDKGSRIHQFQKIKMENNDIESEQEFAYLHGFQNLSSILQAMQIRKKIHMNK